MLHKVSSQTDDLKYLDTVIPREMQQWKIPGLAISVARKGTILYSKGFGFGNLENSRKVDAKTIFPIASTTKSFTATAMATILGAEAIDWDTNVTSIYPDFVVKDPYLTQNITIGDILSHRTGLSGNDLIWYGNKITPQDLLKKVNLLKPTTPFRISFQYNNLMYVLAGHLIERLSGLTYGEYLKKTFLVPIGMESTFTNIADAKELGNYARPYASMKDTITEIPHLDLDMVLPAGGLFSNVGDLSKWLMFLMSKEDQRELCRKNIQDTQSFQIPLPKDPFIHLLFPESRFISYGMGWFVHSYKGITVIEHTGNTDGYSTHLIMLPELDMGVVILTNLNTNFYSFALKNRIIDFLYSKEETDWNDHYYRGFEVFFDVRKNLAHKKNMERKMGTKPTFPLEKYIGNFSHTFYGSIRMERKNDLLTIRFLNGIEGALSHWHYDTFKINWENKLLGDSYINFSSNRSGEIAKLNIDQIGLFPLDEDFIKDYD